MDLGLSGQRAIVCGSSRGLGRAVAAELLREGAEVVVVARGLDELTRSARSLQQETGRRPWPVSADVTRAEDRERLVAAAEAHLGGVDILVANAGGPPPGPFVSHDLDRFRLALDLAVISFADLVARVVPGMRERGHGRIAQIVSVAGLETIDGLVLSNTSRPAALGLAKALSRELGPDGVLVNSVCPGIFLTDRIRELVTERARTTGLTQEACLAQLAGDIPLGRTGEPREIGDVVAFLVSPRNTYVTGATIVVDGGRTRRLS